MGRFLPALSGGVALRHVLTPKDFPDTGFPSVGARQLGHPYIVQSVTDVTVQRDQRGGICKDFLLNIGRSSVGLTAGRL